MWENTMLNPEILHITPRPAPRPRLGKYGAYNESWYTKYKKDITILLKGLHIPKKDYAKLEVRFGMPYPKTVKGGEKNKIEGMPHRINSGDVDNLLKPLKDAMQDVGILQNDCQIYYEAGCKVWTNTTGYIMFFLQE